MFDNLKPEDLAWLILLLPLLSAAAIGLFTHRSHRLSAQISITAVVLSFLVSCGMFAIFKGSPLVLPTPLNWLNIGDLKVEIGLRLDPLSLLMLLVVTGVGTMIHIYSYGYMKEDRCMGRYFGSLSLFMFSMLGIVLSNNLVMTFIFWELVGVSSYLLIGFWYEKPSAADACKKAFITNRLGDFGFILGIILVWSMAKSVDFDTVQAWIKSHPTEWGGVAAIAGLLIFCGAMGKSAQFPLHVWLPDAMEGPTPVSALIHAATMVAAGVYMLCRVFFLFGAQTVWPDFLSFLNGWSALDLIAWIGGFTALIAALMAVQQNDIKRILAYSTLSQLGYMVMAVGLTGPVASMYHLTTHAFFKALLFLGAGSVIYACHHEQDIWHMGGLKKKMPVTFWTFLLGTLALCGVPPLSGFYSKDSILAAAADPVHGNVFLFILASVVAFLTTFYMSRLVLVTFFGGTRSDHADHAHESPKVMAWPLILLAVPTVLAGFLGIDGFFAHQLEPGAAVEHDGFFAALFAPFNHSPLAAFFGLFATVLGFSLAFTFYAHADRDPLPEKLGAFSRAMRDRFYFDEIYKWLIAATHEAVSRLAEFFDRWIVAGLAVHGAHGTTELFGRALRLLQTGNLQTYAFLFVAGVVLVLWFVLGK